jgi:sterol desaturase/sphingolipid hydroxylase (fatty acid hydroxylase superfamily)
LPAALLGFPLWAFLTMHGLNLIYQFWIHTKLVRRIGFLENVLNTPSHHRVHHGVNDDYLDKNYGGIFIFWDKMFGTFTNEAETPRYGITKPLESCNWLWINLHGWVEMLAAMRERKTVLGKLRCVFGSPDMNFEEAPSAVKMPSN